VLDRDGGYMRTIKPYPASTPLERTEPVGHVMIDGKRQPLVFNGQGHTFHPYTAGLVGQTMAWHPDGYLIAASAVGSMCNHGPPRFLIAFDARGGAPKGVGFTGPHIRKAIGFRGGVGEASSRGMDRLAVSLDGKWIYLVLNLERNKGFQKNERRHGVYRVKWSDKGLGELWLGKNKAGSGDDEFDDPEGLAIDAKGNLYVCDRNNDRVKVYSPEGKLLGKISAPQPEQIAVHPRTGEVYLLCRSKERGYDVFKDAKIAITSRLIKFAAWGRGRPKELARMEFLNKKRIIKRMALDYSGDRPKLWATFYIGWGKRSGLVPITEAKGGFKLGSPVGKGPGLHYPSFLAADPERNRAIVFEHLGGQSRRRHKSIDLKTGEITAPGVRGSDLAIDRHGNVYMCDTYGKKTMSRYGPDFKPLPFSATGTNKLKYDYRAYGVGMGLRGHVIAPNGDIYIRRSPNHSKISTVDVFGPDGKMKQANLVRGAGSGDSGIGIDTRGNVSRETTLKPADRVIPDDFAKVVPAQAWRYYRRDRNKRPVPWRNMYANPYLFHMGSVLKFGPKGGRIYGNFSPKSEKGEQDVSLDKAPADAVALKSGYLGWDVKVSGAKWRYEGVGIIPHSFDGFRGDDGCECLQTQLDADLYGRVYAPSVFYSSVEMLDSAGNRIARVGTYGNADDGRDSGGKHVSPEVHFAWPCDADYAEYDGKLYVTDSVNRRVAVIRFEYTDSRETVLP